MLKRQILHVIQDIINYIKIYESDLKEINCKVSKKMQCKRKIAK